MRVSQRAEIVFFARAEELHPTHGIDVADALLAATVMKTGGRIRTLDRKHFPMPDLLVEQAW